MATHRQWRLLQRRGQFQPQLNPKFLFKSANEGYISDLLLCYDTDFFSLQYTVGTVKLNRINTNV